MIAGPAALQAVVHADCSKEGKLLQIVAQGVELLHPAVIAALPTAGHALLHVDCFQEENWPQMALQTLVVQFACACTA